MSFKVIAVATAAAALLSFTITATLPTKKPPPGRLARVAEPATAQPLPVKKTDRLAVPAAPPVEQPLPPPSTVLPPKVMIEDEEPPPRRSRRRAGDLCTRHNLRKVYTNNGKSWRCRR